MLNAKQKRCPECKQTKSAKYFSIRKGLGYLVAYCKLCQTARKQVYYQKNGDQLRKTAKAKRDKIRNFVDELKANLSCKRCGFNEHPVALDFHHRDPSQKKFRIGQATAKWKSYDALVIEIAKCDVLCANCHRITHLNATS